MALILGCAATASMTAGRSASFVFDSGLGTLEDNDITANGYSGVAITTDGNPTLCRNRINRNEQSAVYVHDSGRGVVEDNDLTGNKSGPWNIDKDSRPNLKRTGNRERSVSYNPILWIDPA